MVHALFPLKVKLKAFLTFFHPLRPDCRGSALGPLQPICLPHFMPCIVITGSCRRESVPSPRGPQSGQEHSEHDAEEG